MAFKNHYNLTLGCYLLGVVLSAVGSGVAFVLDCEVYYLLLLLLLLAYFVYKTFRLIDKTNEQFAYFVRAVENNDTSLLFPSKSGNASMDKFYQSMNRLNRHLNKVKVDSQIREKYFGQILAQIDVGVMLYTREGIVWEVNAAALRLFRLPVLTHLRQLDRVCDGLMQQLLQLPDGGKQLLSIPVGGSVVQVVIHFSSVSLQNRSFVLMTLQDIRGELERKEIDAWVKLIRVLNHEITNSLTPVASLSESLHSMWKDDGAGKDPLLVDTTLRGLSVIEERSRSLVSFVNSYRMLTKLPELHLDKIEIGSFLDRLSILASQFRSPQVSISVDLPATSFSFIADESMLMQVMLNLIKNGVEAIDHNGFVRVGACLRSEKVRFTVEDSGRGIPESIYEEVFVPFFTTKSQGSGIGLSHSQQIVRAHGGGISFTSSSEGTCFFVDL